MSSNTSICEDWLTVSSGRQRRPSLISAMSSTWESSSRKNLNARTAKSRNRSWRPIWTGRSATYCSAKRRRLFRTCRHTSPISPWTARFTQWQGDFSFRLERATTPSRPTTTVPTSTKKVTCCLLRGRAAGKGKVLLGAQVAQSLPQGSIEDHRAGRHPLPLWLLLPFSAQRGEQRRLLEFQIGPAEDSPRWELQHSKRPHLPAIRPLLLQRSFLLLPRPVPLSPQAVRQVQKFEDHQQGAVVPIRAGPR